MWNNSHTITDDKEIIKEMITFGISVDSMTANLNALKRDGYLCQSE